MITVEQIDPANEPVLRLWWQAGYDATRERPYDDWPTWEAARRSLRAGRPDGHQVLWVTWDGDTVAGAARAWVADLDNTHLLEVEVYVPPEHRRRGIGTALLAEAERLAAAEHRSTLLGVVAAPLEESAPGVGFAEARGYRVAGSDEIKVLDLADALTRWEPLQEEADAAVGDYRIHVCDGAVPDELVDPLCALLSRFLGEIPLGEVDLRDGVWTPERLRETERVVAAAGSRRVTVIALAPDGAPAGFHDAKVNVHDPTKGYVGGTLVLAEHRGRRLGLAMKLAGHRRLAERFPECRTVMTGNAGVNTWMNAVNERMGYRVVERMLDLQKVTGPDLGSG